MWITDSLPDSDLTVLLRLHDNTEYPVWAGFHDGERWCSADAATLEGPVAGWMQLEDAAALLDSQLIAAAPELLSLVERMLPLHESYDADVQSPSFKGSKNFQRESAGFVQHAREILTKAGKTKAEA